MPEDSSLPPDLQEFSKGVGLEKWKSAPAPKVAPTAPAVPAAPAEPGAPGEPEKPPEKPFLLPGETEGGLKWYQQAYEGATRGLSGLAATALKYGAYATPLQGAAPEIAEWAQEQPFIQDLQRHAEEPDATAWETAGNIAAQIGGTAAIPGFGTGTAAERGLLALANRLPMTYVRRYGMFPSALSRYLTQAAKPTGQAVTRATKGAAGGALSDPEHPGTAAAGGALVGSVPIPAKKALSGKVGRTLAELAAVEGTYYGAHKATGLNYYPLLGPALVWRSGLFGPKLRRLGDHIIAQVAKTAGRVPAGTAGYFAGPTVGQGMREAPENIEELGRSLGYGKD